MRIPDEYYIHGPHLLDCTPYEVTTLDLTSLLETSVVDLCYRIARRWHLAHYALQEYVDAASQRRVEYENSGRD